MATSPATSRGASGPFAATTVTFTDAQLKALPTTRVELVAAPGAGNFLVPVFAWMHLTWVADYTNVGSTATFGITYGQSVFSPVASLVEAVSGQVSNLLADGASHAAFLPPRIVIDGATNVVSGQGQFADDNDVNSPLGAALNLFATNSGTATGNFTGGDAGNSLKVTVYYATFAI